MKPNMDINAKMVDNAGSPVFMNGFFDRFVLRRAPQKLKLNSKVSKDYLFPTLQADVTFSTGIFPCSYKKAMSLVSRELHPAVKPVSITGGRSVIVFCSYEYKNVMNMRPYNELAMLIPVMVNTWFRPALLPLVMKFRHYGVYVAGMPVTSYENQLRGNLIWGMPKVTRQVDITREYDECVTRAYEKNGKPIVEVHIPVQGTKTDFDETTYVYTRLKNRLLRAKTCFNGSFNVNKHMGLIFKKDMAPARTYIKIGTGPSAQFLNELEVCEHPLQTRFAEHVSTCIDLPDEKRDAWFDELNL